MGAVPVQTEQSGSQIKATHVEVLMSRVNPALQLIHLVPLVSHPKHFASQGVQTPRLAYEGTVAVAHEVKAQELPIRRN